MTASILKRTKLASDRTVADFLASLPQWLEDIGIGFNQLVHIGRNGFDFSIDETSEFLRLCIFELYRIGARPATSPSDRPAWYITEAYGTTPEAIADSMIGEWLAEGAPRQVAWGRWWCSWPDHLP